jgi:hypothetical protein
MLDAVREGGIIDHFQPGWANLMDGKWACLHVNGTPRGQKVALI